MRRREASDEAVAELFNQLMAGSSIDNKLTGHVKMAHEEQHPEFKKGLDEKVERMSNAGVTQPVTPSGNRYPTNANTSPAGAPPGCRGRFLPTSQRAQRQQSVERRQERSPAHLAAANVAGQ